MNHIVNRCREITVENGICRIPLTRGYEAIADEGDYELIKDWSWFAVNSAPYIYAARHNPFSIDKNKSSPRISMHRLLSACPEGMVSDHINGDTLDNRRFNLRVATQSQNKRNRRLGRNNTSGVPGVHWNSFHEKWVARISIDGVMTAVGTFKKLDDARAARIAAEESYYGKFGRFSSVFGGAR